MKTEKAWWRIILASIFLVIQYILAFFVYKMPGLTVLHGVGWMIWVFSLIFGIGPILIFRQRGGVAKGKSYVETTRLVDTSLYAMVRHPQYLAGILFNVSLMFLAQHWLVIALGAVSATLIWLDIRKADREGLEKFGAAYQEYMQRVPQMNFLLGAIRLMRTNKNRS